MPAAMHDADAARPTEITGASRLAKDSAKQRLDRRPVLAHPEQPRHFVPAARHRKEIAQGAGQPLKSTPNHPVPALFATYALPRLFRCLTYSPLTA